MKAEALHASSANGENSDSETKKALVNQNYDVISYLDKHAQKLINRMHDNSQKSTSEDSKKAINFYNADIETAALVEENSDTKLLTQNDYV